MNGLGKVSMGVAMATIAFAPSAAAAPNPVVVRHASHSIPSQSGVVSLSASFSSAYAIDSSTQVAQSRLLARLQSIDDLRDGWLGKGSVAARPEAVSFVRSFVERLGSAAAQLDVVSSPDGAVITEWLGYDDTEVSVEIRGDGTATVTIDTPSADVYVEEAIPASLAVLVEIFVTTAVANDS